MVNSFSDLVYKLKADPEAQFDISENFQLDVISGCFFPALNFMEKKVSEHKIRIEQVYCSGIKDSTAMKILGRILSHENLGKCNAITFNSCDHFNDILVECKSSKFNHLVLTKLHIFGENLVNFMKGSNNIESLELFDLFFVENSIAVFGKYLSTCDVPLVVCDEVFFLPFVKFNRSIKKLRFWCKFKEIPMKLNSLKEHLSLDSNLAKNSTVEKLENFVSIQQKFDILCDFIEQTSVKNLWLIEQEKVEKIENVGKNIFSALFKNSSINSFRLDIGVKIDDDINTQIQKIFKEKPEKLQEFSCCEQISPKILDYLPGNTTLRKLTIFMKSNLETPQHQNSLEKFLRETTTLEFLFLGGDTFALENHSLVSALLCNVSLIEIHVSSWLSMIEVFDYLGILNEGLFFLFFLILSYLFFLFILTWFSKNLRR